MHGIKRTCLTRDYRDPLRLCKFLLGELLERGVRLHHPAKVVSVAQDMRGELASVQIAGEGGSEINRECFWLAQFPVPACGQH